VRIGVVGAGITGLATAFELLRRGHEVRCYEAATPMAARSVGDTRIFRLAHQRPELVEWAVRARAGWTAWSAAAGSPLVGSEGTVVGGDVDLWAAAMAAAGAPHRVTEERPGLPAPQAGGPFLLDPGGGVIRAAGTGRFLLERVRAAVVPRQVDRVEVDGGRAVLVTTDGAEGFDAEEFDSVVLAAGAGTAVLAEQVGIAVPAAQHHHVRFTFPLRDPDRVPPCWIDRSGAWRAGFGSYAHLAGPGRWAIGGHHPDLDETWPAGREAVTDGSRELVTAYVAEHVTGAVPEPVDSVHCAYPPGLGDGVGAGRSAAVLAVWGDNLFKLAPVLAEVLADAAVDRSLPADLLAVGHRR
jgi:sarcosine oxidase